LEYFVFPPIFLGNRPALVGCPGPVQWDTLLAPVVGGLCWIGDFEGVAGVDVASAKFLGYL
jgi:hypothetical protein